MPGTLNIQSLFNRIHCQHFCTSPWPARWTTFWSFTVIFSWDWKHDGQIKCSLTLLIFKKMFLYCWVCDFQGLKVFFEVKYVRTLNRWGGKLNHHLMAYSLKKNYWNRKTTLKIIVGGWVVYFLRHSVYGLSIVAFTASRESEDQEMRF